MTIVCTKLPRIGIDEGLKAEFKTSIFFAAGPTKQQPEEIARTVAAFINTEGGDLYLGVRDDGVVVGIENDLNAMGRADPCAIIRGPFASDASYCYKANGEQYFLKVQKIVEAYLGKDALRFLDDMKLLSKEAVPYMRVSVRKAHDGEYVRFKSNDSRYSEIWIRTPGAKRCLIDCDRDAFIQRKANECSAENEKMLKSLFGEQLKELKLLWEGTQNATNSEVSNLDEINAAKDSLVERIHSMVAKISAMRKTVEGTETYHVFVDPNCSTIEIIDEFRTKIDGRYKYARMEIGKCSPHFASLPYLKAKDGDWYELIEGIDFELDDVRWIVERTTLSNSESAIVEAMEHVISMTRLKQNLTSHLQRFAWSEVHDQIRSLPFHEKSEVSFSRVYLLKGESSSPFWGDDIYQITGMRFVKKPLRHCPNNTKGLGYWAEDKLLRGMMITQR